jgi:putative oxidoreductase
MPMSEAILVGSDDLSHLGWLRSRTHVGNEMAVNDGFEETRMSTTASDEPKLFFPGLAGFYTSVSDLWYPMIRVAVGAILFVHGWGKLDAGVAEITAYFARNDFVSAGGFAYAAMFLETVGALCIMLGLFTRFFAAALTVGLCVAFVKIHLPKGFEVSENGFEYVLLEGIVMFAIALRGGGPYSLDRIIGKQL